MDEVRFIVEAAGCASCAARVGKALEHTGTVHEIQIDEEADVAVVRLSGSVSEEAVNDVLRQASEGAGHRYRVQPGSWDALP